MNWPAMLAIVRRDLTVVARSRAVSLPILILPLLFFVLMPAGVVLGAPLLGANAREVEELLALMPGPLLREVAGLDGSALIVVWALEYVFATFFLIVPLMTSAVIAADSFAGEKERKTLEALVYTPVRDIELFAAKVLAPWLAAVAVAGLGYVAFVVVANLLGAGIVGGPIAITARWALVVVVLAPGIAALAVGALVLVSARVRGFQEAYQLGGLVVLPVVVLLVGQLTGTLYLDVPVIAAVGLVVWLLAAVVLRVGYRSFRRENLLVQL